MSTDSVRRSRAFRLALAVTLGAILSGTLFPSGGEKPAPMLDCLVCGERGVAAIITNIILFLPLGALLELAGWRLSQLCLAAAALSAAIELAQLFIPGRDSSLSDVLSNTCGAAVGWLLLRYLRRVVHEEGRGSAVASLIAAGLAILVTAGSDLLLRPALPASVYYGQRTPNLEHLEWYRGQVSDVWVGGITLPDGRMENSDTVRRLLLEGAPLKVRATAGPEVTALASLVSVYDEAQREIVLLGPDRQDLVFRYRTQSTAWRLDQPDLRVRGALALVAPGETLVVTVWREPTGYCLECNGASTCHLGFTAGRGWSIVFYPEHLPGWLMRLLDVGWLVGLWFQVGLCARRRPALWAVGSLLAGLALAPALTGVLATPVPEWLGGVAGALAGIRTRSLVSRYVGRGQRESARENRAATSASTHRSMRP